MTVTTSPEETEAFASALARTLEPGTVVALDGDLGAGKTHFTRGLVLGLGGDARQVSSPTYTILQVYETPRMAVFHLDAYRLAGADDLESIGFDELLTENGLVVIEWASRVVDVLPQEHVAVHLIATDRCTRQIEVRAPDVSNSS